MRAYGRRRKDRSDSDLATIEPNIDGAADENTMQLHARLLAVVASFLATVSIALSGEWPAAPIHVVVPFTPGASTDVVVRLIAPKVSEFLGESVVVENRSGAGGLIATEAVAGAKPDGYTLLAVTTSFAAQPAIMDSVPYDAVRDFAPIALLADLPGVLVVNPTVPVKNFAEFLDYARSHRLTYGSAGIGTFPHLGVELLKSRAGISLAHVPYRGAAQALADVIAGHVDLKLDAYVSASAHIADGSLRALAVSSLTRLPELPDIPTVAESGFPGFEVTYWIGIVAPATVPESIRARLERAFVQSMTPEIRASLVKDGVRPVGQGRDALYSLIGREVEQWRKLAKEMDLTIK
jgi:tripartite-type tricarboxylate transporter receptor subunit TctC